MPEFEHFVKGLGPHAKLYTTEQLKQLHIEVRRLAEILLAIHESRTRNLEADSPQPVLDEDGHDRTIEKVLTERVGGSQQSRADDS